MSTSKQTIEYVLDQLQAVANVRARKMFGEYALYCDDKVVALVCDDQLFVKITPAGKDFVGAAYIEGRAYPSAKVSMLISADLYEDADWISELIRRTAAGLDVPKNKPRRKSSRRKAEQRT